MVFTFFLFFLLMAESSSPLISVRDALLSDIDTITSIYKPYVLHDLSTFEEVPPTSAEMLKRYETVLAAALPYLVATVDGEVVGYSYATPYRPRPAYCYSIENSVYVREGMQRLGIGSALLVALIERCEAGPFRQMVVVIGDSGNVDSIALHNRHGFQRVGAFKDIGFKLGRWVDTVLMQRSLGPGNSQPPVQSHQRNYTPS